MQGKYIVVTAAGVLAAGVCWAGALLMTPPTSGSDAEQIRRLAQRASADPLRQAALPTGSGVSAAPVMGGVVPMKPAVKTTSITVSPPAASATTPVVTPAVATAPEPKPDPVRSIALTGVTHESGADQALLLNLDNNDRETVRVGGSAFGFIVRRIQPESVVLARGSDEYTVRLGDKQVPTSDVSVASADIGFGGPGGLGGGRGEGRGGNDAERNARRAEFFARMQAGGGGFGGRGSFGGRGDFGRGGFGGGNFNGGGGNSFSTAGSDSGRGGDRGRGDDSDRRRDNGRGNGGGGGGNSVSIGMPFFGGWGGGRSSNQSGYAATSPTSNPQTARRRGGQLVGGANAMDTPAPINNPQTQRRLGTTSSGPAFGQDPYAYNPNGRTGSTSRTGNNRSGSTNSGRTFR